MGIDQGLLQIMAFLTRRMRMTPNFPQPFLIESVRMTYQGEGGDGSRSGILKGEFICKQMKKGGEAK